MEGIVTVVGFVGMAFILAMIILNEVWGTRFDGMREQIHRLSNQVDSLKREQERMERLIERRGEGRLTGIEAEGRFRG